MIAYILEISQFCVLHLPDFYRELLAGKNKTLKLNIFQCIKLNVKPLGVLSEKDFVRKLAAENRQASNTPISEIMSYKFRWVEPSTPIEDAVQKMLNNNIRRLLVLDNGKLIGVITQTDLAAYLRDQLLVDGTINSISTD